MPVRRCEHWALGQHKRTEATRRGRMGTGRDLDVSTTHLRRLIALAVTAIVAVFAAGPASATSMFPSQTAATTSSTLVGAASSDWPWFDAAVGPVQVYRDFDVNGFHYATWQATPAYTRHPNALANDYSFDVLPQRLTDPTDPINDQIRSFLATTPKNLIITNFHEPDNVYQGRFTAAQFRAGAVALARMVRAQNALDGGTRMTSVVLMGMTLGGYGPTTPDSWWPNDARDGGHADIIEVDVYAFPHNTNTAGIPRGYTDGIRWRTAKAMLNPTRAFAVAHSTQWAVAEIGFLEDVNDPMHKAQTMADAVAYATANGAQHINYFDCTGPRADWRLRYSTPVGTTSSTSNAVLKWKALVAQAGGA
jgi:hypothetical protein